MIGVQTRGPVFTGSRLALRLRRRLAGMTIEKQEARHGPLSQARNGRERDQGRRRQGARDGRGNPRRRRGAARRGGARAVAEIRQLVARVVQADAAGDRARHRAGRQARPRRHQVCAGAGAQFRAEAEGDHARSRGRDPAGRDPRPPAHPGELDRLLRAGRALSDGRLGAHVDRHRAGRRREAHHRLRAAVQGRAASGDRRRHAFRRRRRDLRARRRAGGRRHGARHRDDRRGRHDRRARQRLRGGSQAPAVRPRRHRPARRPDRDADHRRRQRRRRDLRDRPARPGRARSHLAGDPDHQFGEARARHHGGGRAHPEDPSERRSRRQGVGRISARSSSATTRRRWCARPTASPPSTCR